MTGPTRNASVGTATFTRCFHFRIYWFVTAKRITLDGSMKIALISGTSIVGSKAFDKWEQQGVLTPHGSVKVKMSGGLVALNRHGFDQALPPHAINYRANIDALCELGVDSVLTLSSVGSVDPQLPPGSLVSCSDYMSFAPKTFIDDTMSAFAPVVGNPLLEGLRERSRLPILSGKIYLQTRGPRFETRAEVRAIRMLGADVVGMTFANEADLILERGLQLTSLCMVDNFAHGVGEEQLTRRGFEASVTGNRARVDGLLADLLDFLSFLGGSGREV